ncbi:MAG: Uma2 family endonuclease [Acidobacteriota bacterium]|nr:Uma2 family endonuclease [Acidobacteriota bacterium]
MAPTIQAAVAVLAELDGKEYDLQEKGYELIDGKWEAKDMGSSRHGGVGTRLIIEMGMHVKLNRLGGVYGPDTTFQIGHNERLPDISFISAARMPEEGETDGKWLVAPDLAVEVVSPSESWAKVNRKIHDYFSSGVQQVWLVSLEFNEIHVYDSPKGMIVLGEDDQLTSEKLLPGFRCSIRELFQAPAGKTAIN